MFRKIIIACGLFLAMASPCFASWSGVSNIGNGIVYSSSANTPLNYAWYTGPSFYSANTYGYVPYNTYVAGSFTIETRWGGTAAPPKNSYSITATLTEYATTNDSSNNQLTISGGGKTLSSSPAAGQGATITLSVPITISGTVQWTPAKGYYVDFNTAYQSASFYHSGLIYGSCMIGVGINSVTSPQ